MSNKFQVAYIPIGVPTFDLESAQKQFHQSIDLLSHITKDLVYPEKMLLTIDDLTSFLETIEPNLIILQNVTFANAAYASEVLHHFSCPILLWTLREPVIDGGKLRLNSLTGAYSAGNTMKAFGICNFDYVFGSPEEKDLQNHVRAVIRAANVHHLLKSLKIAAVGHTPQGFGFGRALDSEMLNTFGVTLESIEARELMEKAKNYSDEECTCYLQEAQNKMIGLSKIPQKNVLAFCRLCKAYFDFVAEHNIGALSSRCWPDFFTDYGTPVCSVLAMLNEKLIPASCESDVFGALSMFIGTKLTGKPTFFGDPVLLNEQENSITYWHCGTGACSLAREDTGAIVGVHPNRKIGPVMDFGCKKCGKVTVFRVGRLPNGCFRFFAMSGEALDKPKQFCGTSVVVKTENCAKDIVYDTVKDGWEPHFVVIYGDVKDELQALGNMLNIPVDTY